MGKVDEGKKMKETRLKLNLKGKGRQNMPKFTDKVDEHQKIQDGLS